MYLVCLSPPIELVIDILGREVFAGAFKKMPIARDKV